MEGEAEVTEQEEFEFRLRLEKERKAPAVMGAVIPPSRDVAPPATNPIEDTSGATLTDKIKGGAQAVRNVLGSQACLTGFYSYGELCPQSGAGDCSLHNQTMTITTLSESI